MSARDEAALRAHLALPHDHCLARADVFGAAHDAASWARRARGRADAAVAEAEAAERVSAEADAALAAWDAAHPLPEPPVDGAQPEDAARARLARFVARQAVTT